MIIETIRINDIESDCPQKANNFVKHNENNIRIIFFKTFEKGVEFCFLNFSKGLVLIGPFFSLAIISFISLVAYVFFKDILPYWVDYTPNNFKFFTKFILTMIFLLLLINVFCNYMLAVLVRPGCVPDLKNSKFFQENDPYYMNPYIPELDISHLKKQVKQNDKKEKLKLCKTCNEIKPLRTHHCAVCGYCVFKMDHHCPWINNCVGQNNQRYFVLFLLHTLIGLIFTSLLSIPKFFWTPMYMNDSQFNFVCILSITCSVVLIFFNTWNWFLVLNGNSAIEFWSSKAGIGDSITDFSMTSLSANLFLIFGTNDWLRILLFPSVKKLPYSGLEWTKLVDENFCIKEIEDRSSYLNVENDFLDDIGI
jgi:hypothetical protein